MRTPEQMMQASREANLRQMLAVAQTAYQMARSPQEQAAAAASIASLSKQLDVSMTPPPVGGGQLAITPKEKQDFELRKNAQRIQEKYQKASTEIARINALRMAAGKEKNPTKDRAFLMSVDGKLLEVAKDRAEQLGKKPRKPAYDEKMLIALDGEEREAYKARVDAQYQSELAEWEAATRPALDAIDAAEKAYQKQKDDFFGYPMPLPPKGDRRNRPVPLPPNMKEGPGGYLTPGIVNPQNPVSVSMNRDALGRFSPSPYKVRQIG
jgi:hypothetical protein